MTSSDSCRCGWDGPGNHCWLCHTTEPSAARLIAHIEAAHDITIVHMGRQPDEQEAEHADPT